MEESRNRETADYGFMAMDTATKMIEKAVAFCDEDGELTFMFQGGEPTLIGIPWYEEFIACVGNMKKEKQTINYAIQTNGMLLDDAWFSLLKKHDLMKMVQFHVLINDVAYIAYFQRNRTDAHHVHP